ncbi:BA14K family protein [Bartonella sp. B30(2025)]
MKKLSQLAVLLAASTATVMVPLGATFANTKSIFDERITSTTIISPSYPAFGHHHPTQEQTHIRRERHQVHHEEKTHHYTHTEHHKHVHNHHYVDRGDSGETIAAGLLGLAAGALLGNVLKKPEAPQVVYQIVPQPERKIVYQAVPQTQVIYQAQPSAGYQTVQQPSPSHWSWLQYCKSKYRSFNEKTGTFKGYDGKEHFCYAPLN